MNKPQVRAFSAPWRQGVELSIWSREENVRVKEIIVEKIEEGICAPPAFTLNETAAQVLMDDLWQCGIRPTEGAGSAGAMLATQKHLEDMRKLAFSTFAASGVRPQAVAEGQLNEILTAT